MRQTSNWVNRTSCHGRRGEKNNNLRGLRTDERDSGAVSVALITTRWRALY